ncbi:hypothetical protein [Borreliella garinii]|uniref:hypothetical protein n=1 Tax=Borreliella garinii TaxID=29519 RepID=UPI00292FDFBE|nr:hypothetical protein [Borreliella garinii]WNZ73096.1 hypothetical protein PT143_04625 [Borreliella garinii]
MHSEKVDKFILSKYQFFNKEYKILDNGVLKLIDFRKRDKRLVKFVRIYYSEYNVNRKDEKLRFI